MLRDYERVVPTKKLSIKTNYGVRRQNCFGGLSDIQIVEGLAFQDRKYDHDFPSVTAESNTSLIFKIDAKDNFSQFKQSIISHTVSEIEDISVSKDIEP